VRRVLNTKVVLLSVIVAVLALLTPTTDASSGNGAALRLGVTHTGRSLDPWSDGAAVRDAKGLLSAHAGTLQNQHVMGWGVGNPEPSPGSYDWSGLDRRVALIHATNGSPVITLAGAPDWMKGGAPGETNWSKIEAAPTRAHYADFAELARQVAIRYPDVKTFQVWNEMKGFWDASAKRWRYEDYTDLYNAVYDALKALNPAIQVGGPYVSMTSSAPSVASNPSTVAGPWGVVDQRNLDVITYWLAHNHGADFIAVDGSPAVSGGKWLVPPAQSMDKLRAINSWIRQRTSLPIWWSELYAVPYSSRDGFSRAEKADIWKAAMTALADSGASVVLFWQPETGDSWTGLWEGVGRAGGGKATALYNALGSYLR
jgi:hypothetical protein